MSDPDPPAPRADAGAIRETAPLQVRFRSDLLLIFLGRITLNTAHRIVYPFLPTIARGLGLSMGAASSLISLRVAAGLIAPLVGPVADRLGRRRMMEGGLLTFVVACALLLSFGTPAGAAGAFFLFGLAKVFFDPSVLAYIGDSVPYARRARTIGLMEIPWALAWLLGVPASGFLMERYGWRAPWAALIGAALLSLALIHFLLARDKRRQVQPDGRSRWASLLASWGYLLRQPGVPRLMTCTFLLVLGIEFPFIVYGAWLESSFGLSLSTMGLASMVVGAAEATAELGTMALTDRWGKQRSVVASLLVMAAGLGLLPILARLGLAPALGGVFLMVMSFEFAIVSMIPLATELVPDRRASFLSLNATAISLGRIAGATAGGWLWQLRPQGIGLHATVGALLALLTAALMSRARLGFERRDR